MTLLHGDGDEMGKDHGVNADEADQLLSGRVPADRDDLAPFASDLASLSAAYVREVDPVDARRWAARAVAHARLTPSDKGDLAATPASNADRPAPQASGLPKRRIAVLESILAFLATTAGKVAAAGALVAATTTGGLAATGNLPGQDGGPERVITQTTEVDDDLSVDDADTEATDLDDQAELDDQDEDCEAPEAVETSDDDADDDEVEADETSDDDADDDPSCDPAAVAPADVVVPEVEAPEVESEDDDETEADDEIDDEVEADDDEVEAPEVESEDEPDATDDDTDEPSDDSDSEVETD